MNKILFTVLAILMLSITSCESFFDLKPYNSTEQEDILNNEDDAQTLLNGMYASFKSSSSYGSTLTVLMDIMTDASLATSGFTNQLGQMYSWNINAGISEVTGVWANHYSAIYNANFLINNIDNLEGDEENLNRIKGEALIGRALLHYNLVRLFGKAYNSETAATDLGVPYLTINEMGEPQRNTVEEVYQYIKTDLDEAINLIGDYSNPDAVTFNAYFAKGLAARLALDMRQYSDVVKYTTDVIENSGCVLSEIINFGDMWLNDTGDEIIWKVGLVATDKGVDPGYNFFNRNSSVVLPQPDYIPAEWLLNLYDVSNDVRALTYYVYTQTGFGWDGVLVHKYPTNPMFDYQGANMPKPMRLAEMYLMRAEAHAYLNQDELAQAVMEDLLSKRISHFGSVTITGEPLKNFIAEERLKELMFEGFYWFDLKRNHSGFQRVPQENTSAANDLFISADDYRWQWPIPTAEINGNPNIKQNAGY